jgi:thiol-disulfide isomerase/thioredoxin
MFKKDYSGRPKYLNLYFSSNPCIIYSMINPKTVGYTAIATIGFFSLCSLLQAQSESTPDSGIFKYRLEVGKILYYTSRGRLEYTQGTMDLKENLEIWVLALNPDSSWRLLLHNTASATRQEGRGKSESLPENTGWAFCDFDPRGHYTRNWAMDNLALFDLFLPNIFPPLPADFSTETLRWECNDRLYGESTRFTAARPDSQERSWVVKLDHTTPLDEVYLMNQKADIYIDMIKGIPIYKKEERIRGYGYYAGQSNSTVILDSIIDFNESYADRYARELTIFLASDSVYNQTMEEAEANPTKLTLARSSTEYLLSQTRTRLTIPGIRKELEKMIDGLTDDFKQITEGINSRSKFVNKSAPRWKVDDLAGRKISLEDFLGNVVLLDFWYRACPWCIRSMPLVDKVAQHFKGKPVVVLGVNTDKDREDALFVIQKIKPDYKNLSGRDLIKKYGVTNYPTFIIIDRNGMVRRIQVGYETGLAEKLIEIIESFL